MVIDALPLDAESVAGYLNHEDDHHGDRGGPWAASQRTTRRTPWLPGNYLASIEQQGKKLAEISWTVTP